MPNVLMGWNMGFIFFKVLVKEGALVEVVF